MVRCVRVLLAFFFSLAGAADIHAQQPQPEQMASLHPASELHWQRTSPAPQHSDGPVLYQLVFSPGTPGAIAKFDTNTRHLVSSDITENGGIVSIGSSGFTINVNTGIVTFAGGQTFPGTGTVTSVGSTAGITGGPITGSGTFSLDTTFTNNLYPQLATSNTFTTGTQVIQTGAAGTVGVAVQGASAQTANLQEWRDNTGRAMASVSASGKFSGDGSALTNLSTSQLVDDGDLLQNRAAPLAWYRQDFATGKFPNGVGFDGSNIWVANSGGNTVTKLHASDGALLGTFPVGVNPTGVAFDGSNIWVTNDSVSSYSVTKLRASDGTNLGTFPVGLDPDGIAFDGVNIWIAIQGGNSVAKLRASDGATLGTFPVGVNPMGVAFDGANIWVTNHDSKNISKLRASDGATLGTFSVSSFPWAIAFDGANLWITLPNSNSVIELRASDGTAVGTFAVGTTPVGVAFDGANIWVTNEGSNSVTKLRSNDGTNLGTFPVGTTPVGVAFDGASIWVGNQNSNTVSRF